jgi:hypothetical protein
VRAVYVIEDGRAERYWSLPRPHLRADGTGRLRPGSAPTRTGLHPEFSFTRSDQQIQYGDGQQAEADHDVHLKEGDIDAGQVVGADQGMLVDQECGDGGEPDEVDESQRVDQPQDHEGHDHQGVARRREPQGAPDAERPRDAAQADPTVEFDVLAGVDDIEAGDPEEDGHRQQDRRPSQVAPQRDPGGDRCQAEREAEPEVGEAGESLGVGVAEQPEQYRDREDDRPSVREEQECRGDEGGRGHGREGGHCRDAEQAGGEVSAGRPGVHRVEGSIGQPVERHGRRPRRRHAEEDAEPVLGPSRPAVRGAGG